MKNRLLFFLEVSIYPVVDDCGGLYTGKKKTLAAKNHIDSGSVTGSDGLNVCGTNPGRTKLCNFNQDTYDHLQKCQSVSLDNSIPPLSIHSLCVLAFSTFSVDIQHHETLTI